MQAGTTFSSFSNKLSKLHSHSKFGDVFQDTAAFGSNKEAKSYLPCSFNHVTIGDMMPPTPKRGSAVSLCLCKDMAEAAGEREEKGVKKKVCYALVP